jgi:hypothetical protein
MEMERGERNSDTSNLDSRFEDSLMGDPNSATEHPGETGFMRRFPERLFGFLECEEFSDTIWWTSEGEAFGIDPKGFTEKVLKKHFHGMKFESFRKSLNRWGFHRICVGVWRHVMFQRSKPEVLEEMRRKPESLEMRTGKTAEGSSGKIAKGSSGKRAEDISGKTAEGISGKRAEGNSKERLQMADNAPKNRKGEDSYPPMSSRRGLLQSNPLDQQLSQQSGYASEGTPLLRLRDSHIPPYRAVADHQHHQVYPLKSAADLLAEYRLQRLRQEEAEVRLLEAQKEKFAAETNLRLLQAQKEQELARLAHFSQISNFPSTHSLQDVSGVPCGVQGGQRVLQSQMVSPPPSSLMLDSASRTVAPTTALATNQVSSCEGLVVSAPMHVAMHNDTVRSENLSSVPVVCTSSQSSRKRPQKVLEELASDEDSDEDSKNDCAEKRQRTVDGESGDSTTQKRCIGSRCTGKWEENFNGLMRYRQRTGDCRVPHCYKENTALARWVKRQRYQYRLMMEGQPSSHMTEERVKILEEAGFVWDSQAATWEERLEELKAFCKTQRHCNVPTGYSENISLGNWVKCQRRQYMLFKEDKKSNMTAQRVNDLESIGFEWQVFPSYYPRKKN